MLREDPGRGPTDDRPRGQRVLRPQAGRVARGPAGPFCDRRPPDAADQTQVPAPAVRSPSRGVEVAEFRYQPNRWPHPYRFVVIRRPQSDEPTAQLTLFKLGRYHYQVLVTNLPLQPLNLWRFYNDRAGVELLIKQLKGDYALGSIPTRHFFANETYFHLLLLAYNLVNWFKRLCLPAGVPDRHPPYPAPTILLMPAQLRRVGNRPHLFLPASGPREAAWTYALDQINTAQTVTAHSSRRIQVESRRLLWHRTVYGAGRRRPGAAGHRPRGRAHHVPGRGSGPAPLCRAPPRGVGEQARTGRCEPVRSPTSRQVAGLPSSCPARSSQRRWPDPVGFAGLDLAARQTRSQIVLGRAALHCLAGRVASAIRARLSAGGVNGRCAAAGTAPGDPMPAAGRAPPAPATRGAGACPGHGRRRPRGASP